MKWHDSLNFTEKLKPWHLWLASVIIYAIGLLASAYWCADHFSRSGALIIAMIVGIFSLDPRKDPEFMENLENKYFPRDADGKIEFFQSPTLRAFHQEEWERRLFLKAEGFVLMVGTIVWGFGDLLADAIIKVSQCSS